MGPLGGSSSVGCSKLCLERFLARVLGSTARVAGTQGVKQQTWYIWTTSRVLGFHGEPGSA